MSTGTHGVRHFRAVALPIMFACVIAAGAVQGVDARATSTVRVSAANRNAPSSPWKNIGPTGGDILSIAVDPKQATTVFCGALSGGIFKSTNGGTTWQSAGLLGTDINAIAFDPSNPSTIYVGSDVAGFYVSTNGG